MMLRFWQNLAIGSKLAGLAILLVMVVVLSLTYLTARRERASFQQELEGQARLLLETLPRTMRDPLYWQELDELIDIARVVSDNEDVTLFIVYDRAGAILVDASLSGPVYSQVTDPLGELLLDVAPDQTYLEWQEGQLVAGRAVSLGNQQIGAVAIGLSTEALDQKISALTQQSILLALVTLVFGSILAFLLARQITNPLSELTYVAAQMASGNLSTRMERQSKDEIGQLSDAFNQMAWAIQRRETDLRDLAAGLERIVADRTAKLREQNEALIEINQELVIARRQAEAASRAKSAFLSMVSHELRTPLTSVLGFAKLIKKRLGQVISPAVANCDGKVQRAIKQVDSNVDIIVAEGERLTVLINDVLDLAKIESGKMEWNAQPVSIQEVIERSVAGTHSLFADKSLGLIVDVAEGLPVITGDRDRLIQVVVNLISNAVKFTNEGTVTCRARQTDEKIVVSVTDTGIGIDPRYHDKIFGQFVQLDGEAGDRPKGTGLGLPICREIVEHHGGHIWVESELGQGSTFSFALPAPRASTPESR